MPQISLQLYNKSCLKFELNSSVRTAKGEGEGPRPSSGAKKDEDEDNTNKYKLDKILLAVTFTILKIYYVLNILF